MWRNYSAPEPSVIESLARYFAITEDKKKAKFLIAKTVASKYGSDDSLETLWQQHARCNKDFLTCQSEMDKGEKTGFITETEQSYLTLKTEIAKKILQSCHFCNRRCGVNRLADQLGFCNCGKNMSVSSIFMHTGEEPEFVPSGTIFTMGCTIRCRHCQNWTISQWQETPMEYAPIELAKQIENLYSAGCRNVNLVGGEPTPWLKHWLETFLYVNANMPVVWNSNSYYSQQTAQLLAGFVDVYLLDFKYGPGDCAEKISDAPNYWQVCTRNHLEAKKNGELLIRVLVLPGHLECCTKPTLQWIAENLGVKTRVNLMFQYRPEWRAGEIAELRDMLTKEERKRALQLAKQAGLRNLVT